MKQRVIYRVEYLGTTYRIRCYPLTYQFSRWLGTQATDEPDEHVLDAVLAAAEAECELDDKAWSKDLKKELPAHVLRAYVRELIAGLESTAKVQVELEKN